MNTDDWTDMNLKVVFLNFSNASENIKDIQRHNDEVLKNEIQLQEF